jgi:hypothetical protein
VSELPPEAQKADYERWLRFLNIGFSLLVQGVGSKFKVLEEFADDTLLPWGAAVVRMPCFHARFSLSECLRDVFDQLHPGAQRVGHASADNMAAAICAARRVAASAPRPLCLLVHSLELLPEGQQAALARLARCPSVHLIASVDSIFVQLAWRDRVLEDFNFCREVVHTHESYQVEVAARYPDGLPTWADGSASRRRAPRASLALVLRSLSSSHQELVKAMAEHQLKEGGQLGISFPRLMTIAADRMIVSNTAKLRSLVNELQDHAVVRQRPRADGVTLLRVVGDLPVLQRLAKGEPIDEDESDDSGAES